MIYYITQYALTTGVYEISGRIIHSPTLIADATREYILYHKPHWHETVEEAMAQAEKMRIAKIASLRKQMAKLEKLTFRVPT